MSRTRRRSRHLDDKVIRDGKQWSLSRRALVRHGTEVRADYNDVQASTSERSSVRRQADAMTLREYDDELTEEVLDE